MVATSVSKSADSCWQVLEHDMAPRLICPNRCVQRCRLRRQAASAACQQAACNVWGARGIRSPRGRAAGAAAMRNARNMQACNASHARARTHNQRVRSVVFVAAQRTSACVDVYTCPARALAIRTTRKAIGFFHDASRVHCNNDRGTGLREKAQSKSPYSLPVEIFSSSSSFVGAPTPLGTRTFGMETQFAKM